jgi:hypothetical protein
MTSNLKKDSSHKEERGILTDNARIDVCRFNNDQ